jgi:hypothetical protein
MMKLKDTWHSILIRTADKLREIWHGSVHSWVFQEVPHKGEI